MPLQFELPVFGGVIKVNAGGMAELFENISQIQECLPGQCGNCSSTAIVMKHRKSKTRDGAPCDYYELACQDCKYEFPLGMKNDGSHQNLYPGRKNKSTGQIERGWFLPYQGGNQDSGYQEQHPQNGGGYGTRPARGQQQNNQGRQQPQGNQRGPAPQQQNRGGQHQQRSGGGGGQRGPAPQQNQPAYDQGQDNDNIPY